MKNKLGAAIFAAMMILGIVFIGDAVSSNSPFSAQAQVVTVRVVSGTIGGRIGFLGEPDLMEGTS